MWNEKGKGNLEEKAGKRWAKKKPSQLSCWVSLAGGSESKQRGRKNQKEEEKFREQKKFEVCTQNLQNGNLKTHEGKGCGAH